MDRDDRIHKLKNGSETAQWAAAEIDLLEKERIMLRSVFESARAVLRFNGADKNRFWQALDNLDEFCERVKRLDEGNDDA